MPDRKPTQKVIRDNHDDFAAIVHRRKQDERINAWISLESLPVSVLDTLIDETTDCEMYEARFKQLDAAIATLNKLDQQLLFLKYYEDMDLDDIARCTGLTKNNAHVRLYRIGVRLKSILIHGRKFRNKPCRLTHDEQDCYEATG